MITEEEYKELKESYKKIKSGMIELELCLDNIGSKLNVVSYDGKHVPRYFSLPEMIKFGNKRYGVFKDMSRHMKNVYIRHSFIYLARSHGYTYMAIAKHVKLNHPTIIHAYKKVSDYLFVKEPGFLKVFNQVVEEFNNHLAEKGNEYLDPTFERDGVNS
jgi:hypothetical protein